MEEGEAGAAEQAVPGCYKFCSVLGPRYAGGWRRQAVERGSKPPPAGQKDRHQHRMSRFSPPAKRCVAGCIPYQCFKVPASRRFKQTIDSIWLAICALWGRWHRPSSVACGDAWS